MENLKIAINEMLPYLDEKQKRLYLGSEAKKIGRGGNSLISKLSNISRPTIIQGRKELDGLLTDSKENLIKTRVQGGGRKKLIFKNDKLLEALECLVEPVTRGDPESPLRWTCKSIRTIESELKAQGYSIGRTVVGELLHQLGYSLQSNSKVLEGNQHIDRNAQFEYINKLSSCFQSRNLPVISVDTKKKELIGNYKNSGQEYRPKRNPRKVEGHDFGITRAAPYGIYDIAENTGFVNVGKNCDTGEFAVESIRKWWNCMGKITYPNERKLLINADGGGSNGHRLKLWKKELQKLSNEMNMQITVCHFPPGTSKWNKIEHRLFSQISLNWKGIPLESYETVVSLIGSVKTTKGLKVKAELDENIYQKGIKVTKKEIENLMIKRRSFHGDWNYTIMPNCKC
jgi:transposase